MTEFKLRIEDTKGTVAEQTITHEKSYDDYTLQDDLDQYLYSYIQKFAKANHENGTEVKSLKLFHSDGHLVREVNKNNS